MKHEMFNTFNKWFLSGQKSTKSYYVQLYAT